MFTENLLNSQQQVTIQFYQNAGNQSLITNATTQIIDQISETIKQQLDSNYLSGVLTELQVPEAQAEMLVESIQNKVNMEVITTNTPKEGLHNSFAPLLLTMASNVSAFMGILFLSKSLDNMQNKLTKWKAFITTQVGILLVSIIAPLGGLSIFFI